MCHPCYSDLYIVMCQATWGVCSQCKGKSAWRCLEQMKSDYQISHRLKHNPQLGWTLHTNVFSSWALSISMFRFQKSFIDTESFWSLCHSDYIVWSTRSSDVVKLCPTRKKTDISLFFIFLSDLSQNVNFCLFIFRLTRHKTPLSELVDQTIYSEWLYVLAILHSLIYRDKVLVH